MIDFETIFDSDREEYEFMQEKKEQPMKEQIEEIDELTTVLYEANHKKSVLDYRWLATEAYNAGYRKQSEVIEEYRQKVNTKMGKHTHLLGKEYVQRILREVAKEMKGGAE